MYDTFFKRQFDHIRGVSTDERKNEIINYMVNEFTLYVLSTINYDDYVIPNYTRKILHNFNYEYIITSDEEEYDYIKVNFPDFKVFFDDRIPLKYIERDLKQRILKYAKINHITLPYDEVEDEDIRKIFITVEPSKVVDVLILHNAYEGHNGKYVYIRDIQSPYLIHKFLCYDNDIYKAINETNRSITEFMAKFESDYNSSFFL